jgi:hypothetical protein
MQKRNGWRLLGLTLVVLACVFASMGPASQAAKAENCCACGFHGCESNCYWGCNSGADEACMNACFEECRRAETYCIEHCPYPIC